MNKKEHLVEHHNRSIWWNTTRKLAERRLSVDTEGRYRRGGRRGSKREPDSRGTSHRSTLPMRPAAALQEHRIDFSLPCVYPW